MDSRKSIWPLMICVVLFIFGTACWNQKKSVDRSKPNIIIFYADDIGYGDVGCYGATGAQTPHIDALAENGIRFTDAHSSAATCTPSRYSLLTGRYAFQKNTRALSGKAPLIISTETPTLPAMLQKAGYKTSVIGKWHLGLGDGTIDWNGIISPGPLEIGFDYCFIIPATGDRVPCVFVENHRVVNADPEDPISVSYKDPIGDRPTGRSHPDLLKMRPSDAYHDRTIVNGVSRLGYMAGGEKALWVDEDFPFLLTQKVEEFIETNKDRPFFLFYSFHDIHVPRVIHPRFQGKSRMGPRGDAIVQVDWSVGEIMKILDKHNPEENTLIIFTSDNGPVLDDGYIDQAVELLGDHKPAGPLRGGKYSAFEAGTRVPFIAYWPGVIQSTVRDSLIGQIDLFASLAALTNQELEPEEASDSQDFMETLLGKSISGREYLLEESYSFSLRYNHWKYIQPHMHVPFVDSVNIEGGYQLEPQLYDLSKDIGEQNNLAKENPELLQKLSNKLNEILGKQ
jgi:arylsulfatase A